MSSKDIKINRIRKRLLNFKIKKDKKTDKYTTIYLLSMFSFVIVFSPIIVSNYLLYFSILLISIGSWAVMLFKSISDKKVLIRIENIQNKHLSRIFIK